VYPHFDGFVFWGSAFNGSRDLAEGPYYASSDGNRVACWSKKNNDIKIWIRKQPNPKDDRRRRWRGDQEDGEDEEDEEDEEDGEDDRLEFTRVDSLPDVSGLAMSQDGKLLAATTKDGRTVLWDTSSKSRLHEFTANPDSSGAIVVFSSDSKAFIRASGTGKISMLDTGSWASIRAVEHGEEYRSIKFAPEGKLVLGLTADTNTITIWDPATGSKSGTIQGGTSKIHDFVLSPDG
jgi:WD40 repeat protein